VRVPEVRKVVLDLPRLFPADFDVGVAPARRIQRADVVAAQEGDPAVHRHEVAVVAEDVARVRQLFRTPQRSEVERLDLLRELLEGGRDDHVREAVEDDAHPHALARLPRQGLDEAAPDLVPLPDERADEDGLRAPSISASIAS
jgi:hypothetical protein